jgi:hypothetical protein
MKVKSTTLYCFSPPVMVATFVIELILMLYVLIRYKWNALTRLIASVLFLLATFQLAEYQVCSNGGGVSHASRIGFIAITLLPAIGIHIISLITNKISKYFVAISYGAALAFALFFGLGKNSFNSYACGGNYAIFHLTPKIGGIFFAYYYFLLLAGISVALYGSISSTKKTRQILMYFIFGYLVLLIPTGLVNVIDPRTINGIPSIMCGFALVYALVLAGGVAPLALKKRSYRSALIKKTAS